MRQAALLGNPDTKRTQYLQQAAEDVGLPLAFVDWKEWKDGLSKLLRQDAPLSRRAVMAAGWLKNSMP